jgi:TonB-dependent starch-binding outer membrane protein SusC
MNLMKFNSALAMAAVFFLLCLSAQAQNTRVVRGVVSDSLSNPLANVSVTLKGTPSGTKTAPDGSYVIALPDGMTKGFLVFTIVGYEERQIAIPPSGMVSVSLTNAAQQLGDVVVVGYGTQRKVSMTGAVDVVGAKDIGDKPVLNTLQALQGEAPNLIIQQTVLDPGSGVNLNIRGLGTLGDNTPLVVIDGIIGGDINTLNPNDVASVSILKDAGAAAIYGSRSANGVILVTTKSGKLNQKPTVSFDGSYGLQHADVLVHKVSAAQNAYYKNMALVNSGLPPAYTPEDIAQLQAAGNGTWDIQHLLKNAPQMAANMNISGGSANSSYFISGGYQRQGSNLEGNGGSGQDFGYTKYNLRLNQTSIIGKFKFNSILSYVKTINKNNTVGDNNIFADANRVPINYSWQDSAGNYLTNPVASQYNEKGVLEHGGYGLANNDQIFGNLNGVLSITRDLKLTGIFGGTINSNSEFFRREEVNYLPSGVYGNDLTVFDNNYKDLLLNTQLYAEYTKGIGDHNFKVLLGASNESFNSSSSQLQNLYTDPQLGIPTTGTTVDAANSYNSNYQDANGNRATQETSLNSVFGRLNYAYKDRYFFEGNFRDDASSKFAQGHRASFFPSGALSWLATEEPFMQTVRNTINQLKVRTSYGILGNQNVNAYQYQTTYFNYPNSYGFNNSIVGGAGYLLGNPDLTWEKAATFNVGLDLAFLHNNLKVSADYFNKTTSNILAPRQDVPAIFGAGFPDANVAKVQNRGWEFSANYTLHTHNVTQHFSFNIADNKNKLLALSYGVTQQIVNADVFSWIREVGQPITSYYGYKTDGYFQNNDDVLKDPKPVGQVVGIGDLKFKDQNHDGVIDDKDRVIIGNPFPRYTFGFTYSLEYEGFDLQLFIQGVGKRDEFLRGELVEPFHYNYGATVYDHQTDFWTPTNRDARFPRLAIIGSNSNTNNWRNGSDLYRFNAAYARLKNVNIGYTLPHKWTAKAGIQRLRVSLIGQNLFTLTKLKFIDPETSEFDNNLSLSAASNSARAYPLPIFYGAGLNVTF